MIQCVATCVLCAALSSTPVLHGQQMIGFPDCGPQCVRFLSCYYERPIALDRAHELCGFSESSRSTSMLALKQACEKLGLHTLAFKGTKQSLNDPLFSECSFIMLGERNAEGHFELIVRARSCDVRLVVDPVAKTVSVLDTSTKEGDQETAFLAVSDRTIEPLVQFVANTNRLSLSEVLQKGSYISLIVVGGLVLVVSVLTYLAKNRRRPSER